MERTRLLEMLARYSYRSSDKGAVFELASGKRSSFYVDCRATTMRSEALPLVGAIVGARVPAEARAIGGMTMGADPIALAAAYWCAQQGRSVHAFSVRKQPKEHGLRKWIDGCVERGGKVVVVDDVVTTGGSTIAAMRRCRDEGLEVVRVVVLVDREEEGGLDAVRREAGPGVDVLALFTRGELEAARRAAGSPGTS